MEEFDASCTHVVVSKSVLWVSGNEKQKQKSDVKDVQKKMNVI